MYSVNSIFLALLALVTNNQGGYVVLHSCIAPLWGDAEKIADFYADAEYNSVDPEYVGHDFLADIEHALEVNQLVLPPYPGTGDDPLAMTPDGLYYLDPAAANAHFAALMAADAGKAEALAAVGAEATPTYSTIVPADGGIAPLNTEQIDTLTTDAIALMTTHDVGALTTGDVGALSTDFIAAL